MRAILRTNNMKASVDETGVRKQLGSCYSRKHREHKACSFPCGPEKMLGGCKFHQLQIRTRSQWFTVHSSAFEWLLYRITGYEKSVLFPTTLRNNIWQFVKCQLHVVPCTVTTAHAEADLCFPLCYVLLLSGSIQTDDVSLSVPAHCSLLSLHTAMGLCLTWLSPSTAWTRLQ